MTTRIKGCVHAAAIALLLPVVASAETVPLFDETLVTSSGFGTDISRTEVFKKSDPVTVYCDGNQTAHITDDNGGPPIVDNYMTAGDDDQSICLGGSAINSGGPTSGTHCFVSGNSNDKDVDIRTTFNAVGVTAPVSLTDGENNLTFKLWDYGVVYGNSPLVLELPENCTANPPLFLDVKPQSFPNAVNICSNGVIPIAIAGSAFLPLDGYTVKSVSIGDETLETFGRAGKDNCAFEDVVTYGEDVEGFNPDTYGDYVCHIPAVTFREEVGEDTSLTVIVTLTDGVGDDLVFELEGDLKQTKLNCL